MVRTNGRVRYLQDDMLQSQLLLQRNLDGIICSCIARIGLCLREGALDRKKYAIADTADYIGGVQLRGGLQLLC